jgi:hypothetical protein
MMLPIVPDAAGVAAGVVTVGVLATVSAASPKTGLAAGFGVANVVVGCFFSSA